MSDQKTEWKVIRTVRENEDVTSLYIEGPKDKIARKKPGQFASIRVMREDGTWSEPHPFTISCGPGADYIQMTIKDHGEFTRSVKTWEAGTPLQCSGPLGVFCKDIYEQKRIVMIAGGVGITPFLSVLRGFRDGHTDNEVVLLWCNKTLDDAFAHHELSEMTQALNLRVVHILSRVKETPCSVENRVCFIQGRLNADILRDALAGSPASVYLCGPEAMQEAALEQLRECGVDPDAVQREAFSFQKK